MRAISLLVILAFGVFGCSRPKDVVSGSVNVNGQPVARGFVTFFPQEGTSATRGGEVKDGLYTISNVPPGKWRALVTEVPDIEAVQPDGGPPVLKIPGRKSGRTLLKVPAQPLTIEIHAGLQTLDLRFHRP